MKFNHLALLGFALFISLSIHAKKPNKADNRLDPAVFIPAHFDVKEDEPEKEYTPLENYQSEANTIDFDGSVFDYKDPGTTTTGQMDENNPPIPIDDYLPHLGVLALVLALVFHKRIFGA